MEKSVPVWLLLLFLLVGGLLAVGFGWAVQQAANGRPFRGLAPAILAVASFPDTVRESFTTIEQDPDSNFRLPRTADLSDFRPLTTRTGVEVEGLVARADAAALARAPGWRVLIGGFVVGGEFTHAAIVLSPELEIAKILPLPEQDSGGGTPSPMFGKALHGVAMLADGSMVYTYVVGVGLQRRDACGNLMWSVGGTFHHSVTATENDEFVWTLLDEMQDGEVLHSTVVKVATATGEIVQRIAMDEVIAANPTIDILEIRKRDGNFANSNPKNLAEEWLFDPFHLNDVDPLPAAFADRFPQFEAGDLLLSARSLNLVFVLDPDTREVKWWRSGAWRRQHDPDWQPNGEITVYDNRLSRDYSRIVRIEPASQTVSVSLDGRTHDFYSRIAGKHQITDAGNLLVASPQQGRVFEVDASGQVVLDIYNTKPGTAFNYSMTQAIWLPANALDLSQTVCAN